MKGTEWYERSGPLMLKERGSCTLVYSNRNGCGLVYLILSQLMAYASCVLFDRGAHERAQLIPSRGEGGLCALLTRAFEDVKRSNCNFPYM